MGFRAVRAYAFWNADGHCECSGIWTGDSCEEYDDECDHIMDVVDPERSIAPHALNMRTATYRAAVHATDNEVA